MTLRAPNDGAIIIENNEQASGPMQPSAPYKAGDHAYPGTALAQLPEAATLRISARVEEAQRGKVQLKQAVNIRVDAVPDRHYNGIVDEISSTASMDFNAGWPFPKNFTLGIALTARLRVSLRAWAPWYASRLIHVANGWLSHRQRYSAKKVARWCTCATVQVEETVVEVARRSGDDVLVVQGAKAGDEVALKDPTVPK
jgi:multidrug efflux pump subunit AcrA (membrane-fusion protein)